MKYVEISECKDKSSYRYNLDITVRLGFNWVLRTTFENPFEVA